MHVVEGPIGRLIVFRIVPPVSDDNSGRASADLRAAIVASAVPVVVVSDLRVARAFSPDTTDRFIALMKADNPKIERSALLVDEEARTLGLQAQRMVKEAAHASRRVFSDPAELREWLAPVLSSQEQTALDRLL